MKWVSAKIGLMSQRIILHEADLEISHTKGSGPGGQNRNKRMSGVRVHHIPTGITIVATERRSQNQNLEAAKERLIERLEKLFHKPKKRVATKQTKSAKRKRVEAKVHRGDIKRTRQSRGWDD